MKMITWKINGEREIKGMKVIQTNEIDLFGKRILIDVVEGNTKGGRYLNRPYVGWDYLRKNYVNPIDELNTNIRNVVSK